MSQLVVVVGAGGFGRETLDVIEAVNRVGDAPVFTIVGVIDDAPSEQAQARLSVRGIPFLGTVDAWLERGDDAQYLIAIGNPQVRAAVDERFRSAGLDAATVVHPTVTIGSVSTIGAGSVVCAGVQVSTNVALGLHTHVNPGAIIGHDVVLEDYVSINPGAIVSGDVIVGRESLVGAGAVILQGIAIGGYCTVGASACVTRNVTEHTVVKGIPAR